jgi:predicted transcriptional regulator
MAEQKLSEHQIRNIAVTGMLGVAAVRNYLSGRRTKALTRVRVEYAAKKLGIELPANTDKAQP